MERFESIPANRDQILSAGIANMKDVAERLANELQDRAKKSGLL